MFTKDFSLLFRFLSYKAVEYFGPCGGIENDFRETKVLRGSIPCAVAAIQNLHVGFLFVLPGQTFEPSVSRRFLLSLWARELIVLTTLAWLTTVVVAWLAFRAGRVASVVESDSVEPDK